MEIDVVLVVLVVLLVVAEVDVVLRSNSMSSSLLDVEGDTKRR